jgi:hypothetical protein
MMESSAAIALGEKVAFNEGFLAVGAPNLVGHVCFNYIAPEARRSHGVKFHELPNKSFKRTAPAPSSVTALADRL